MEQLSPLPDGKAGRGADRVAQDGPGSGTFGLAATGQNQGNNPTLAPRTALGWGTDLCALSGRTHLCAEHERQLGGASPLPNLMEVKG